MKRIVLTGVVIAVTLAAQTVGARPTVPPRTISFSGYNWTVRNSFHRGGPGPNYFSSSTENVWVDNDGRLHLKIRRSGGRWLCAEVILQGSLGHGTYTFDLDSPVHNLDRNAVLGLFTWDNTGTDHREIDIEFAKWGWAQNPYNAAYTVPPWDTPGNQRRFVQPVTTQSTHAFTWEPGAVQFASAKGTVLPPVDPADSIDTWTYTASVPSPEDENARMNLWLFEGRAPLAPVEVIVKSFTFTPYVAE